MPVQPSIYKIYLSDGTLKATIQPNQVDLTSTSISLPGSGRLDYGRFVDESLVHMVENFASLSANPPTAPLKGQLWYRTNIAVNKLAVYDGTTWNPLITTSGGGNIDFQNTYHAINMIDPTAAQDAATKNYVDSSVGSGVSGKVNRAGDTMTGFLILNANPTVTLGAATKGYVDTAVAGAVTSFNSRTGAVTLTTADVTAVADSTYVNITGDTMSGFLTLNANPINALHATPKQYVDSAVANTVTSFNGRNGPVSLTTGDVTAVADSTYVNATGDSMSGFLTLNGSPVNALHAATKQYVDSNVTGGLTMISPVVIYSSNTIGLNWTQFDLTPYIGAVNAKYGMLQLEYIITEPDGGDVVVYMKSRVDGSSPVYIISKGTSFGSRDANADSHQVMVPLSVSQTVQIYVANDSFTAAFNIGAVISIIGYMK